MLTSIIFLKGGLLFYRFFWVHITDGNRFILGLASILLPISSLALGETTALSKLDLATVETDGQVLRAGKSVDGNPLNIGGQVFADGVGTHADSCLLIDLGGTAREFRAMVGVDHDMGAKGRVSFQILGDNRVLWESGAMKVGEKAKAVKLSLKGISRIALIVDNERNAEHDHADWADAVIEHDGPAPKAFKAEVEPAVILTPKPGPQPHLTGPRVFGARPGNPFLHRVTATGTKPVTFTADGLPPGIHLDPASGRLTGTLAKEGAWDVKIGAANSLGTDHRILHIVGGPQIALTPPMGWNSWNCFASAVSDAHIRDATRSMIDSGLADHGWTYINIDDYWQVKPSATDDASLQGPERDADGHILANPRFPDMKALANHVHDLGLKIGLYSSPGPLTCGGCIGSFDHEALDAAAYAEWDFDYLKYDWCSYRPALEAKRTRAVGGENMLAGVTDSKLRDMMLPYASMGAALTQQKRDIVYSLCQYGMGNVSAWGAKIGGNSWRTTGDIRDNWSNMSSIGFSQDGLGKLTGPGHWNDPDMLVVGKVGWGPNLHPSHLTPNEQYTHISLWCLLSSPLLIGCDLTQLDDFTLGLLTNDEVIAVDQDPLGKQASRIQQNDLSEVWGKPLADGSWAIGLFNRGQFPADIHFDLNQLKLGKSVTVRDLWRQQDLKQNGTELITRVTRHGCALYRVFPKQ